MRVSLLLVLFVACGGTISSTDDAGDGGPPIDSPADHPTDSPGDVVVPIVGGSTFAVNRIYLGEADRNGNVSTTAWQAYGRNVDGLVTTNASTNVCTLPLGAPLSNQVDGANGIDNGWGHTILPIIETAASLSMPSQTVSASIQQGAPTLLVQVVGLTNDATQTATGLGAQVFEGAANQDAGAPAFDTSTDWPVLSTSLQDGQTIAGGAIAQFPSATVTNGVFTAIGTGALHWSMMFQGVPLDLVIHEPAITFTHADASDLVQGTISGVIDTKEFLTALQAVAGRISLSLCGSAFDGIAQQINQAQDILTDGTNVAQTPCTGISIGLGFDAKLVANPTTVAQAPTFVNPCQ